LAANLLVAEILRDKSRDLRYGLRESLATPQAVLTDITPELASPSLELQPM
jgi:hypothetical protein